MDTTDILEGQQVNHYLTMVGQLQWLITLGRFDIQAQVVSMSRFRAQPTQGHLEKLQRIYSYVILNHLPDQNVDWVHRVNGHVQEIIPNYIPDPLGKTVTTTTTEDADLNHC